MRTINKHRNTLLLVALAVVFVAVIVPTCRMVGCSMGGAASWGNNALSDGFYGTCGGTWVTNAAPFAAAPPVPFSLLLVLFAAFVAAIVLNAPAVAVERIHVHASDPPPPPEDPRGETLRL